MRIEAENAADRAQEHEKALNKILANQAIILRNQDQNLAAQNGQYFSAEPPTLQ